MQAAQRLLQYGPAGHAGGGNVPSPVGHMLGGVGASLLVEGWAAKADAGAAGQAGWWRAAAGFALLGGSPDLDLLVGTHSTYTHSVGAVLLTIAAARLLAPRRGTRWALACGAALASHILLDWLGNDTTPPIGIMALWPFTTGYYQSPVPVFMAISRRYWQPHFYLHNSLAVLREIAILVPLVLLVAWWRRPPAD